MIVEFELKLVKCQINTNTNQQGFLFPSKCVKREILILSLNYWKFLNYFVHQRSKTINGCLSKGSRKKKFIH